MSKQEDDPNKKLYRSLIRVEEINADHLMVVVPGCSEDLHKIKFSAISQKIIDYVAKEKRIYADVNIAAFETPENITICNIRTK